MKTFEELIEREELNKNYIPKLYDVVRPLPFVSSLRVNWSQGVVTRIFLDTSMAEVWITTDTGYEVIEYCDYLYPVLTAH